MHPALRAIAPLRGWAAIRIVLAVATLASAVAGVVLLAGSSSGTPSPRTSVGAVGHPASRSAAGSAAGSANAAIFGAATAAAAPGLPSAYYQPPPATPSALIAPAQTIDSGRDEPDPFIYLSHGIYYLYTSEGSLPTNYVPVESSTVVGHWQPLGDAMPTLPTWAVPGFTWAPDVHQFGNHYVLYFTAVVNFTQPEDECIGDAVGTSPGGPFVPQATPFICQLNEGGSIDPRSFTDLDGTTYMIWKSDQNSDVNGTSLTDIYSQPLSATGLQLVGQPTRIFGPDEPWQGRIVEAPDLVLVDGTYYLFYSGGWFNQSSYAIGVARCTGPLGPCADSDTQPWLSSNLQGAGPGEESVFRDRWGVWLLYSPFKSNTPNYTPPRPADMVRLGFGNLGPYIAAANAPVGHGGPD